MSGGQKYLCESAALPSKDKLKLSKDEFLVKDLEPDGKLLFK